MKIAGIIAEYNPFHKGHEYQIQRLRDLGYDGIVAVMSGNFVQRADTSLTDKYRRAEGAVCSGVDLVLELPLPYALASAEDFALGGIEILSATGVLDAVCCGCESGEEKNLRQYEALRKAEESGVIKKKMKEGLSYPAACRLAITESGEAWSDEPNDVLALAYRKALDQIAPKLPLIAIERKGNYHGGSEGYESAESIRKRLALGESVKDSLPAESYEMIKDTPYSDLKRLERGILAYYRTVSPDELKHYYGMREGLPERICKYAGEPTLTELYDQVKTKRFPHSAVRRAVLCGYLKIPAKLPKTTYLRVLAFNEKGQEILKDMKRKATLPMCSRFSTEMKTDLLVQTQLQGDEIFALTLPEPGKIQQDMTESAKKI